jgi:hypothetical protein
MSHPAAILPWTVTGARAVAPPRRSRSDRPSGARAVRTGGGFALFDELGRYVGTVVAAGQRLAFGPDADNVLLRRSDGI